MVGNWVGMLVSGVSTKVTTPCALARSRCSYTFKGTKQNFFFQFGQIFIMIGHKKKHKNPKPRKTTKHIKQRTQLSTKTAKQKVKSSEGNEKMIQ
jgi:hypothetical protein